MNPFFSSLFNFYEAFSHWKAEAPYYGLNVSALLTPVTNCSPLAWCRSHDLSCFHGACLSEYQHFKPQKERSKVISFWIEIKLCSSSYPLYALHSPLLPFLLQLVFMTSSHKHYSFLVQIYSSILAFPLRAGTGASDFLLRYFRFHFPFSAFSWQWRRWLICEWQSWAPGSLNCSSPWGMPLWAVSFCFASQTGDVIWELLSKYLAYQQTIRSVLTSYQLWHFWRTVFHIAFANNVSTSALII